MLAFIIYLASIADGVKLAGILTLLVYLMFMAFAEDAIEDWMKKYYIIFTKFTAAFFIISLFIPSSNSIYLMTAAHYADKIHESEVYSEVMDVLKIKIKEIKKDLFEDSDDD